MVQGYRANVDLLLQQQGSLLEGKVRVETQNVEFDYYDRIGATEANEITDRHGDTTYNNTPHDRRQVGLRDYDWADLIDKADKVRLLHSPESEYAMSAAFALGRKKDDVIISAFFGTAKSGKAGATSVTFPAGNQIAVNYVESGAAVNSGLTIGKLRRARTLLRQAQVPKTAKIYIAVTAAQIQDLLQTVQVGSGDYNAVKALVDGEVNKFMGFEFVEIERLTTDGSGYRRIPVWAQDGLLLAKGAEVSASIDVLPTKRHSTQVRAWMSVGATRMEEGKVLEIKCAE
jgi:hypothetical protein